MCEKTKLTFNIPKEKKIALQEVAERDGLNMTSLIMIAINKLLDEGGKKITPSF